MIERTVEEMITYGTHAVYFMAGVAITLVAVGLILSIAAAVMERKAKQMQEELDKLLRGE